MKESTAHFRWDTTYRRLPEALWFRQDPGQVAAPALVFYNEALARELGVEAMEPEAACFAGNKLFPGSEPLAQAYCGHQFGHFTMLGDGRALLLGEHLTPDGTRVDVQLKGSGRTPFSRGGDGRAALEPMLREVIISEAMHALGIPTTRCLAVAATGEEVYREKPLPGAVLTRIASSHIRVGTFEYANELEDRAVLRALLDYSIRRHEPDLPPGAALEFLRRVARRQAELIARWYAVGFVHGVMNTDNMALSGETIDYGPCAFLDRYSQNAVFSSIDRFGRYAYGQQSAIGQWNLKCLAECLIEEIDPDPHTAVEKANGVLEAYGDMFQEALFARFRDKLGWFDPREGDEELLTELFQAMEAERPDFTCFFRDLHPDRPPEEAKLRSWHARWVERLGLQPQTHEEVGEKMRKANPQVIPRNRVVEAALNAAGEGNLAPFEDVLEHVRHPFDAKRNFGALAEPAPEDAPAYVTFCGT